MSSENIVLYGYFRSGSSWRIRAALAYKGLKYETRTVDLIKGVQKEDAYKQLNPTMLLPTLVIDGVTLYQSLAIAEYLDERFPDLPQLLPPLSDPLARERVRAISHFIAMEIHPVQNVGVLAKVAGSDMQGREAFARWTIEKGFDALEVLLKETAGKCCFGDTVTLADLCLVPQAFNAFRFNVPVADKYPIINRLYTRLVAEEPCFRDTHPRTQPDMPAGMTIDY
ncbi:glutathione transferase zeta 1 [Hyaloraphidium curvatum]|nr:glutathione transferase zeta 1 [Hyaloraphidium curvatum]